MKDEQREEALIENLRTEHGATQATGLFPERLLHGVLQN